MPNHDDEVIATLQATPVRRIFAYGAVFIFGALLILLAFVQPPALGWQIFLIVLGAGALVVAERLRRATLLGLVLTEEDLRDTSGAVLARLGDIRAIDRGALAFKPSNGFVLHLHSGARRSWAPGLWWRFGKRVGVGGVTASGPAKFMAEQIAMRVKPT
ncbi:hypothetical protein [Pseudooctadecabacter jejudonensis]|uniref:Uncharacterized protein n=1 Tax=Pseudooctadecabacter jejudonensis TaxID=1391910 RepID=A0A1Y5SIY6_9RHOB|nr:hypothetical protein [Pseudooctadecabacter jejudonensis]SLN40212.1 hypothetical protein PSJ8397_01994 [Pseudooctadecabacter jejudonensis]